LALKGQIERKIIESRSYGARPKKKDSVPRQGQLAEIFSTTKNYCRRWGEGGRGFTLSLVVNMRDEKESAGEIRRRQLGEMLSAKAESDQKS